MKPAWGKDKSHKTSWGKSKLTKPVTIPEKSKLVLSTPKQRTMSFSYTTWQRGKITLLPKMHISHISFLAETNQIVGLRSFLSQAHLLSYSNLLATVTCT